MPSGTLLVTAGLPRKKMKSWNSHFCLNSLEFWSSALFMVWLSLTVLDYNNLWYVQCKFFILSLQNPISIIGLSSWPNGKLWLSLVPSFMLNLNFLISLNNYAMLAEESFL
jgi:hypothetical protein